MRTGGARSRTSRPRPEPARPATRSHCLTAVGHIVPALPWGADRGTLTPALRADSTLAQVGKRWPDEPVARTKTPRPHVSSSPCASPSRDPCRVTTTNTSMSTRRFRTRRLSTAGEKRRVSRFRRPQLSVHVSPTYQRGLAVSKLEVGQRLLLIVIDCPSRRVPSGPTNEWRTTLRFSMDAMTWACGSWRTRHTCPHRSSRPCA